MTAGRCFCRQVTPLGCEVVYSACPRSFRDKIWWVRTPFGVVAVQDCPEGMSGSAGRFCNETEGWGDPDLFNCTSSLFTELKLQVFSATNDVCVRQETNVIVLGSLFCNEFETVYYFCHVFINSLFVYSLFISLLIVYPVGFLVIHLVRQRCL